MGIMISIMSESPLEAIGQREPPHVAALSNGILLRPMTAWRCGGGTLTGSVSRAREQMQLMAPPPRLLHCFRRRPKTPSPTIQAVDDGAKLRHLLTAL